MPRTSQGKFVTEASKVFQKADDFWRAGSYEEARQNYGKAAGLYHGRDDVEGEAFALFRLGELELSLDNFEASEKALNAAAALVEHADYAQNTYGEILIKTAQLEVARGNFAQARAYLKQAKSVLAAIDNRDLLGEAFEQEAYIALLEERETDALAAYRKAADLFRNDGTGLKEASTLRAIARIEMKHKNYDEAHDVLERCRNLYRENGDLLGEASALSAIGCLRYIIRDIANARKALMKSVYLYGKVAHHYAQAESLLYLARVEAFDRQEGDFERAKAHYKQSIDLFDFMGNETMKNAVLDEYYNFMNRIGGF